MARARLRDLGLKTGHLPPGPNNAITDVSGVTVGFATVIRDEPFVVRTGVTALWPRGTETWESPVYAGCHSFNGNGEMTGVAWLDEQGLLASPIGITNTHQVGLVRDTICRLAVRARIERPFHLPVVAETYDGWLNEADQFPLTEQDAIAAFDGARGGPIAEGNVGGGTGMICHEFKGGTGTASRFVACGAKTYVVGALVQSNYGARHLLRVDGVPVGREIGPAVVPAHRSASGATSTGETGSSIIVVLATDAPLLPIQCRRLARRATTGLAWVGGIGANGSGDLFIAFSTGNRPDPAAELSPVQMLGPDHMTPLFEAAAEATEEAILNSLCAAETMKGRLGRTIHELPHDLLVQAMAKYGRAR